MNVHITNAPAAHEVVFPSSENSMQDRFGKLLFRITSPIPQELFHQAQAQELPTTQGCRACIVNASSSTLARLLMFGSTQMIDKQAH
jgi:hypothetical protein